MLNPYQLTPTASINRVKIIVAPGLIPAWKGKTANELLGRWALIQLIHDQFPALARLPDPLPEFERRYLAQNDPAAEELVAQLGHRLACLLLTLKRGDPENRAARPEWDDSYWTHWASIERIILGGGIVAGLLGQRLVAYARQHLDNALSLEVAHEAGTLPLIGAALKHGELTLPALAFDFGNTAVKRAVYRDKHIDPLPPVPAEFPPEPESFLQAMTAIMVNTWRSVDHDLAPQLSASVANYVQDCQLAPNTNYGQLRELADNSCDLIAESVSQALGRNIKVMLTHDGTAAAYVYAGSEHTAVITLGTSLGMGFPPPSRQP